jgi:hypothetical protein
MSSRSQNLFIKNNTNLLKSQNKRSGLSSRAPSQKAILNQEFYIYILGVLLVVAAGVYFWNQYKEWSAQNALVSGEQAKQAQMLECPDYWETVGKNICKNTNKIGKCSITPGNDTMDFNDEIFTNSQSGNYSKCKWAKSCNVVWGGVDKLC